MSAILPLLPMMDAIIDNALTEDLAGGDLTSEACVEADTQGTGTFVSRSDIVVGGLAVARRVFERLAPGQMRFEFRTLDGERARKHDALLEIHGNARMLLMGERVALNLVQRLSGVATLTRAFVDAIAPGANTRIADTRKTTPGLRILERWAVRLGGGHNHRDMLGSAVLIKDNHIVAAGGVTQAISRAREHAPHTARIECEVETFDQLDEALRAGADILLLDNMNDERTAEAVKRIRAFSDKIIIESSGNISLARVRTLSEIGVNVISVGALTHSAPAADVALDLRL